MLFIVSPFLFLLLLLLLYHHHHYYYIYLFLFIPLIIMMMNDDDMMIACHVCHACIQSMMHGRGQTQPAALAHDLAVGRTRNPHLHAVGSRWMMVLGVIATFGSVNAVFREGGTHHLHFLFWRSLRYLV